MRGKQFGMARGVEFSCLGEQGLPDPAQERAISPLSARFEEDLTSLCSAKGDLAPSVQVYSARVSVTGGLP